MEQAMNLSGTSDQDAFTRLRAELEKGAGMEIVVTLDNAGTGVLSLLQEHLWGGFEWHPLAVQPASFQFLLKKLPAKLAKRAIGEFLGADHRRCDESFIKLENAAQNQDVSGAKLHFAQFNLAMEQHFAMEEEVFFPAFEQATGMTQGPTMVMRMEHRQMRGLLAQAAQALTQGKLEGVSRAGSTLMILMRQHNIKEEQMLYPMADQHLGKDVDGLVRSMQKLAPVSK